MKRVDVAIVGGGLAGLSLALQLRRRRPETSVLVVDRGRRPAPERTWTVGEAFAEVGAHYLREVVGMRDHLEAAHLPKFGLRFFVGEAPDLADRFEVGPLDPTVARSASGRFLGLPLATHQVDRGRLENELARRCEAHGVELFEGTAIERVRIDPDGHRLETRGDHATTLCATWVVFAAAGDVPGQPFTHRPLGHGLAAAWLRLEGDIDVGAWSDDAEFTSRTAPGFRRFSTNHLMGRGYWTWVIPLPSGATSLGVVADPKVVELQPSSVAELIAWLEPRDSRVADELRAATPVPGDFHRAAPTARIASRCFGEERWAVVGQAAAFTDVLYSPGADLIAIGNSLVERVMAADFDGRGRAGTRAVAEQVFSGFVDGLAELYRDQYRHFGDPGIVGTKVVWDSALYFGFHTLLFRHDLFGDPRFMAGVRPELIAVRALQSRVQERLRSGRVRPMFEPGTRWVDWGKVDWLMDIYYGAEHQSDERSIVRQLRASISHLERMARRLEGVA